MKSEGTRCLVSRILPNLLRGRPKQSPGSHVTDRENHRSAQAVTCQFSSVPTVHRSWYVHVYHVSLSTLLRVIIVNTKYFPLWISERTISYLLFDCLCTLRRYSFWNQSTYSILFCHMFRTWVKDIQRIVFKLSLPDIAFISSLNFPVEGDFYSFDCSLCHLWQVFWIWMCGSVWHLRNYFLSSEKLYLEERNIMIKRLTPWI